MTRPPSGIVRDNHRDRLISLSETLCQIQVRLIHCLHVRQ